MSKTNLAESVRQRILNEARRTKQDNQTLLLRYAIERLLYRLSLSAYREKFILKGAALYLVWLQDSPQVRYRPTRDLDFWGSGSPEVEGLIATFKEVLQTPVPDDGLQWPLESVTGAVTREDADYEGARLTLIAMLDGARIPVLIDFGFGDAITPPALELEYPTLLSTFPAPRLRVYPRETVVAEKFQALVALGMANTRMKDFFDLWTLADFEFDKSLLRQAIEATFARRQTLLPATLPVALTPKYTTNPAKIAAWRSFGKRNRVEPLPTLEEVAERIESFLMSLVLD